MVAALTAYVRVFGGSIALKQHFSGPMAKQHRMAVMTAGLIANVVETSIFGTHQTLSVSLFVIAAGSAATCITRTLAISNQLKGTPNVDQ
ncbi:hypothetical protein D3C84_1060980 [compost metagenome]